MCVKKISTSSSLKRHIRRVHSLEIPHTCDTCHKGFASVDMLKRHSQVHQKEKIHGCSKCGKRFARKDILTRHLKTHAKRTAERSFSCNLCDETFNNIFPLQAHQRDVRQIGAGLKRKTPSTTNSRTKRAQNNDPSIVEPGVNKEILRLLQILSYHHLIFPPQSTRIIGELFEHVKVVVTRLKIGKIFA